MNENEKKINVENMLNGKFYDPFQEPLVSRRIKAHKLCLEYNQTTETEVEKRQKILDELMPNRHKSVYLQGPIFFDYGTYIKMGENSYANFNFTVLDCSKVLIGDNVFFGPNVSLVTPIHPMHFLDRNQYINEENNLTDKEYSKPITINNNCWIATGVTICGGVTIGEGSVIGAGSVVVKDIPPMSFAAGNPAKVIRKITEKDRIQWNY